MVGHPVLGGFCPLREQAPLVVHFTSGLQLDAVEGALRGEGDGASWVSVPVKGPLPVFRNGGVLAIRAWKP